MPERSRTATTSTGAPIRSPGLSTSVRFSTVGGEQGSADTVRDPRGFALKFYTEEGNWDLVGNNNTPVFFLRDPMLVPSFIHTQKRLPHSHLKDADMMWDFFSLRPETLHQQSVLFSDRGIPDGFRHMNGYGSHTFSNVNADGDTTYVKYHFKTDQGIRNLSVDQAAALAGSDPDYAIRDLYEAIAQQQYPSWTLYIQAMSVDEAANETLNPFDVTKFAEIEQLAFSPSPDKMLQGRLFSYPDTQRHRLGVNYLQLPVNRPLHDQRRTAGTGGATRPSPRGHCGDCSIVDKYATSDEDNYSQVGLFYRKTLDTNGRDHLTDNIAASLVRASPPVQVRAIANFFKCDAHYGRCVQEKVDALTAQAQHVESAVRPTAPQLNPPRKHFVPTPPSDDMTPRL
ncbi:unnamed protein product [Hyaloperonospora brassicae]|uniref:Catalase core domain-containing protein n=1 Tax=Hyaloperonospora brassicae TaxID=162125 RepID=A0AAV0TWY9_HYABA|nr:unnamed protein product [Hyaloperonospora brassicae]